jgi:2-methylcitrate dehydratase PrpD
MFLAEPPEQKREPRTMVDAQFSVQYAAAAALVHGRASLPEFVDDVLSNPQVLAMAQRVHVEHRPALNDIFPACYASDVTVKTKAGAVFDVHRSSTVGDASNPLTDEQLDAKFSTLAQRLLSDQQIRQVKSALAAISGVHGPRELARSLRLGRAP